MSFIADLHIHSRYSRATSPDLSFETLAAWGVRKGVSLIGTGDCTHPAWLAEMDKKLVGAGDGVYRLKPQINLCSSPVGSMSIDRIRFIITGEISTIYKAAGATRKVHHLVLLPDLFAAHQFAARLDKIGNIRSDGRPILGLDSRDLLEILLECDPRSVLIPAHIWTPWFSVLGSKSGFDSIDECYRDLAPHIFALETGLSSDPPMNWMVSSLDRFTLVSNSDAHSANKLGREANVFDCEVGFTAVMDSLKRKIPGGFLGTLEFFPEEGKYHYDGHRECKFRCTPAESIEHNGRCPVCGGALTLGVEYRVTKLADRQKGFRPPTAQGFRSIVSLSEILGELCECGPQSKTVIARYDHLLARLGPELHILLDAPIDELASVGGELLGHAISKMRAGEIHATAGYDGEFGTIKIFSSQQWNEVHGRMALFELASIPKKVRIKVDEQKLGTDQKSAQRQGPALAQTGLNDEQHSAIDAPIGPIMIIAGPGTGKTKTLVERIGRLVTKENIAPDSILAITFSNRAAREMAQRIDTALSPLNIAPRPLVATFHKTGFRMIAENWQVLGFSTPPTILAEDESIELLRSLAQGAGSLQKLTEYENFLAAQFALDSFDFDKIENLTPQIALYNAAKHKKNVLDLCDLLLLPLKLFSLNGQILKKYRDLWRHVFVDEYQDVNIFQYRFLRMICPKQSSICVIGDPDQAIYGFRGSDVRYFLQFSTDYPDAARIELIRNYRSIPSICTAAGLVVAPTSLVPNRVVKCTVAGSQTISVVTAPTAQEEAEQIVTKIEELLGGTSHQAQRTRLKSRDEGPHNIGFGDIAVLFRTHAVGDEIQRALDRSGIPVQRARRKDHLADIAVQRVLACLNCAADPCNPLLLHDLLTIGIPGLSRASARRCCEIAAKFEPTSLVVIERLITATGVSVREVTALSELNDELSTISRACATLNIEGALRDACRSMALDESALQNPPWPLLVDKARNSSTIEEFLDSLKLDNDADMMDPIADRVSLLTFHAAKGLEWDVVFIAGCEEELVPHKDSPIDEERRLLFVAMTRARHHLSMSFSARRMVGGILQKRLPSRFLDDIDGSLIKKINLSKYKSKKSPDGVQLELF